MNKPVEGRITDMKERYKGGVLKYKQMGYWRPDYEPRETDVICVFRITPQDGAAGADDYHPWLMAAWSLAVAGGAPLARSLPQGPLAFAAPRRPSALHEVSAALIRMEASRSPDWPLMRRRLAGQLSVPALDLLARAAAATPAFEPFFARFVRATTTGHAA